MRKVINEPMKCPIRKGPTTIASHSISGIIRETIGMIKSSTSALTNVPRYIAMMKATASPMTLYFVRKSMNSSRNPFGGGGAGFGSSNSRIRLNSSNILSSDILHHRIEITTNSFLVFMILLSEIRNMYDKMSFLSKLVD